VLGEYLARLLERLSTPTASGARDLALVEPVTPAWIVGSIGVGYDEGADRVVLVIEEVRAEESAEEQGSEAEAESQAETEAEEATEGEAHEGADDGERSSGRVRLTRAQVAAFVERARALVEAGRPTCRFCGRPMNPSGHRCARTNGHGAD
jgi:uncharacterized repeat protein (TIGR03847 family)